MENQRNVSEFIFMGLSSDQKIQMFCFVFFLLCYVALLVGNLLILVSIRCSPLFHQPMYYFLSHSSSMDIFYTSVWHPHWSVTCSWEGKPSLTATACCRSSPCTFLASLRSLSLQSWPLTTVLPSASLSTTRLSWTGQDAISSSWLLGLVGLSMPFLSSLW